VAKVRAAEDGWNTRDPERVALAYTPDSRWRNRSEFFEGRPAIIAFLTRKWAREAGLPPDQGAVGVRLGRIAVRFAYEWHDEDDAWCRSYGNENWQFDERRP
jgi:nuclear transport factor 2 (NTF2) superfamily protein